MKTRRECTLRGGRIATAALCLVTFIGLPAVGQDCNWEGEPTAEECVTADWDSACWYGNIDTDGIPDSVNGVGRGFHLNMSLRSLGPPDYAPRKLGPVASSAPLVSNEGRHFQGMTPYRERSLHRDVIDLITGAPLLQEVDFELPFGGATFRHVRTYSEPFSELSGPATGLLDLCNDSQMPYSAYWDWNGVFWMMSENPIFLIDGTWDALVAENEQRRCYFVPDAHHSIPFILQGTPGQDDWDYVAPPGFDALLGHNGSLDNQTGEWTSQPTEFYVWLNRKSIKYTIRAYWEDLWDEEGVNVHERPSAGGKGLPYYGLVTEIRDRYGNRVVYDYCEQGRTDCDDPASPDCVECCQSCNQKGQIERIRLVSADGTTVWTLLYCHRSLGYDGHTGYAVSDFVEDHVLHSIHVYEGYQDALPGCPTVDGDTICDATSLDQIDSTIDCAVPPDWVIEAKYLYTDGMHQDLNDDTDPRNERDPTCPTTSEYLASTGRRWEYACWPEAPPLPGGCNDFYPYFEQPGKLLKTTITRRSDNDGQVVTDRQHSLYRYAAPVQGPHTKEGCHLTAVFSDSTIESILEGTLRIDPNTTIESPTINDLLNFEGSVEFGTSGSDDFRSVPIMELADLEMEEWEEGGLVPYQPWYIGSAEYNDFRAQFEPAALKAGSCNSGKHGLIDRRAGQGDGGQYRYFRFMHPVDQPGLSRFDNDYEEHHVYHYPYRYCRYDFDVPPYDTAPGDHALWITFVAEVDPERIGSEDYDDCNKPDDAECWRSVRMVEMNSAGSILRDRTWEGGELTSQHGFGETRIYDDYGRLTERRTKGWDTPEADKPNEGLIYVYEYYENDGNKVGELNSVRIKRGSDPAKPQYYVRSYERDGDRPELVTKEVHYPSPLTDPDESDGVQTDFVFDFETTPGEPVHAKRITGKTIIRPAVEQSGGSQDAYHAVERWAYDVNGNAKWYGIGSLTDPADLETASQFFVTMSDFDTHGRHTLEEVDTSTNGPDGLFQRRVNDDALSEALEYRTTYTYDDAYGLTKTVFPDNREQRIVYKEISGGDLEQWVYNDVDLTSGFNPQSPVVVNQIEGGKLVQAMQGKLTVSTDPPHDLATDIEIISVATPGYDENGRLIEMEASADDQGTGAVSAGISYDAFGQIARQVGPDGTITRNVYDLYGRLLAIFRGTDDEHEVWGTAVPCDSECLPADCYDIDTHGCGTATEYPDNLVLLEKRYYGTGVTDADELVRVRRYRALTANQYYETCDDCQNPPPAPDENDRGWAIEYEYDWRMRPVWVQRQAESGDPLTHTLTWYDNLDRVLLVAEYGTEVPGTVDPRAITPGDSSATYVGGVVTTLFNAVPRPLSLTHNIYNGRGQIGETRTYNVSAADSSDYRSTKTFYDHNDNPVEVISPNGTTQRYVYDAKGRQVLSKVLAGGVEIGRTRTIYDHKDHPLQVIHLERKSGATGDTLDDTNSVQTYRYMWYDLAGRLIASANYGTNKTDFTTTAGEQLPAYDPDVPPATVNDIPAAQVTLYGYDDAGRQNEVTDPAGIVTHTEYDHVGRVVLVTENAESAQGQDPRHTAYKYENGVLSRVASVLHGNFNGAVAYENIQWGLTNGTIQVTQYDYGAEVMEVVGTGGPTAISLNNSWIGAVRYPDPDTGQPEADPTVTFKYRADGLALQRTDKRGVTLLYDYDEQDRLEAIDADYSGTPPTWLDLAADGLAYEYTADGMLELASVLDDQSQVLNTAEFVYGGQRQLEEARQNILSPGGLKTVTYGWDTSGDNLRLSSMTYPDGGAALTFGYGDAGTIDDALSRLRTVTGPTGDLVDYRYMGSGRQVELTYGNGVSMTYDAEPGGDVTGLDGFGRIGRMHFKKDSFTLLGYEYEYDKRGNRKYAHLIGQGIGHSWLYDYDPLNRLVRASRGTLNAARDGFQAGTAPETFRWSLDPLGNWSADATDASMRQFRDYDADGEYDDGSDGLKYTEHHNTNLVNEIASRVSGDGGTSTTLDFFYDAAGNLVFDGNRHFVYDAWNRLVQINDPGDLDVGSDGLLTGDPGDCIARYEHDALGRRVKTIEGDPAAPLKGTRHLYGSGPEVLAEYDLDFDTNGQIVDEALERWFVHGQSFPDPLVMVDRTSRGDEEASQDEYLFYLKDPLGSVGALADDSGDVVERYTYDPYGGTIVRGPTGGKPKPGGTGVYAFDHDLDGQIVQADVDHMNDCIGSPSADCIMVHDYTGDGRVSVDDQAILTAAVSTHGLPLDPPPAEWYRASVLGDGDRDGDIDLVDFRLMLDCDWSAPSEACKAAFDFGTDGVLDANDAMLMVEGLGGPGVEVRQAGSGSNYGNPFMWTGQRYEYSTGLYHFPARGYGTGVGRFLQRDPNGSGTSLPRPSTAGAHAGGSCGDLWIEESCEECCLDCTQEGVLSCWQFSDDHFDPRGHYADGLGLYVYARSNPVDNSDPYGLLVGFADTLLANTIGSNTRARLDLATAGSARAAQKTLLELLAITAISLELAIEAALEIDNTLNGRKQGAHCRLKFRGNQELLQERGGPCPKYIYGWGRNRAECQKNAWLTNTHLDERCVTNGNNYGHTKWPWHGPLTPN